MIFMGEFPPIVYNRSRAGLRLMVLVQLGLVAGLGLLVVYILKAQEKATQ